MLQGRDFHLGFHDSAPHGRGIDAMALAQVKRTNPPTLSTPTGYTHIVEANGPGRTIYVSGQIAFDKDGKLVIIK